MLLIYSLCGLKKIGVNDNMGYTDQSLKYLKELKAQGLSWEDIAEEYNDRYADSLGKKTWTALEKAYRTYKNEDFSEDVLLKNMKTTHSARKASSKLRKENKVLLDHQLFLDDIDSLLSLISGFDLGKVEVATPKKSTKTKMTIEGLLSDLHYGLKTKSFDADIARDRVARYTQVLLGEVERYSKNYDVETIQLLLNGDIMQSATMHKDSEKSCHLTNPEQLAVATESLFYDAILPAAKTGKKVLIKALGGNHDREDSQRSTVDPGTSYYTYTVYKALELLCRVAGLTNVEFEIPKGPFLVYNVYGSDFIVEHGDLLKNNSEVAMENHLMRRSAQVDKILQGIRIGHYHQDKVGSLGRHIVNGSIVSDDHYSTGLGYSGRPSQVINFYVETDNRESSYYHSLTVDLD